jgi:hypothetical protein
VRCSTEKKPCYWGEAPPPKKRGVSEKAKASSSKKKIEDSEMSESEESDRTVGKSRGSGSRHLAALVAEMQKMRVLEEERNKSLRDLCSEVRAVVQAVQESGVRMEGVLHDLRSDVQELSAQLHGDGLDLGFMPEELEDEDSETESEVAGSEEVEDLRKEKEEAQERADEESEEEEEDAGLAAGTGSEEVGVGVVTEVGEGVAEVGEGAAGAAS